MIAKHSILVQFSLSFINLSSCKRLSSQKLERGSVHWLEDLVIGFCICLQYLSIRFSVIPKRLVAMYPPSSFTVLGIVLPLLAIVATGIRFLVRTRTLSSSPAIDDWTAFAACFFICAMGSNQLLGEPVSTMPQALERLLITVMLLKGTFVGGLGRHTKVTHKGDPVWDFRTRFSEKVCAVSYFYFSKKCPALS